MAVPLEDASAISTDEEFDTGTEYDEITDLEAPDDVMAEADPDDIEGDATDVEPEAQDDDEENPIWKEIAALAQEARDDSDGEIASESTYTPPDDMPPIQSSPAIPDEAEPLFDDADEDERPWEGADETEGGFSDFVWNDPSKDDDSDVEIDDTSTSHEESTLVQDEPETSAPAGASSESLNIMDDDLIAAALNEQMAVEDALEDAPKPVARDISDIPVELGGPRARVPNVEALKNSVRSKSVKLTTDELKEQVPARRFRRGFSLILLIFVVLGAAYISRGTITEYLPVVGPYLESYANFVDLLRGKAEVLGAYVWDLVMQGYDWIIAKFFS